jgi:hypothetical protein
VRRSRLYYLRDLRGKKARLRSKLRDLSALISEEEAEGVDHLEEGAEAVEAEDEVSKEAAEPAEERDEA